MTVSDPTRCGKSIADDKEFPEQAVGIFFNPIKLDILIVREKRAIPSLPALPPLSALPLKRIQYFFSTDKRGETYQAAN